MTTHGKVVPPNKRVFITCLLNKLLTEMPAKMLHVHLKQPSDTIIIASLIARHPAGLLGDESID